MDKPALNISLAQLRRKRGMKWTRYGADVIPAWVADMDFPIAAPIREAIDQVLAQSDFGYPPLDGATRLLEAFADWMATRHGWQIDPADAIAACDVVQLMHAAVTIFSQPGDGVIVQTPIYPPFLGVVAANQRRLDENPLVRGASRYEMDFDQLNATIDGRTQLLMLCNPHNPTGRVFTEAELHALAEVALRHDLTVISDEIHMDLVFPGATHIPFASLGPEIGARTVTLTSASKSFNIAGTHCAVAHFGSPALRARFEQINLRLLGTPSTFGLVSAEAAWGGGAPWLEAVIAQLDANRRQIAAFLDTNLPEIGYRLPEATYLAWLDCADLNLSPAPSKFFLKEAKVALNPGADFSPDADQFARLNFATTPEILHEILTRMATAVKR